MGTDLQAVVNAIGDLPPMPVVAVKVLDLLQKPTTTADKLAETISSDQAVSARVLKIANSSFYSLRRQVTTLEHAIVIMGEKTLKSLVLASSLKGINKSFGLMEKMLWEDSLGCAIGSRMTALWFKSADPEEAFLAGLFRHIGKMMLNNVDAESFRCVLEGVYNGEGSEDDLEAQYFPFGHAVVGEAVLDKWNFSADMTEVTRYHDNIEKIDAVEEPARYRLAATVNLADAMCRKLGIGRREPEPDLELALTPGGRALEVEPDQAEQLLEEFRAFFEKERDTFLA
ncbi:HD family phosphohydrolase [Geothermobacter hydrogeniphilus]|uniref:HD family phosphohydrolase n=1 Tax=Geothermobacter hydrogeniphilus TaxID=1969733 RepID=A0A2K2H9B2_9BACT|nr:HDOD domain-containing protein [Geothermobacter hydrogeniphilus]PNU19823.1 HD family phosphohydrolase [Geothermobacter hydrogeniphilus]